MRLDRGTALEFVQQGPYDYRNHRGDYWYEVSVPEKGMKGWVFGAHTSWAQWAQYDLETFNGLVKLLVKQLDNPPGGLTDTRCSLSYFFLGNYAVVARTCPEEAGNVSSFYSFALPNYQYKDLVRTFSPAGAASGSDWYRVNERTRTISWTNEEGEWKATLTTEGTWVLEE